MNARVYLVGAGPGSPDYLTVKAARIIGQADVILHDALVCQDVLDLAPNARKILVGKRAGQVSTDQGFINRLLVASAREGGIIVRLKGGDPMIFGRAHEEIEACRRASIDVEIVPGVTAASAAAAHIGASLTLRGVSRSIAFVTPTVAKGGTNDDTWADAAVASQTVAIYMGATDAVRVRNALISRGLNANVPVVLVQNAGRSDAYHRTGCLGDLHAMTSHLGAGPTMLLLGDVFGEVASQISILPTMTARLA